MKKCYQIKHVDFNEKHVITKPITNILFFICELL